MCIRYVALQHYLLLGSNLGGMGYGMERTLGRNFEVVMRRLRALSDVATAAHRRAALGLRRRKFAGRRLNLALQGGGAHGAFTWGVLDRLLEEEDLEFAAVSGTSAGAINAVLLAAGLREGGAEQARQKLREFWKGISSFSFWRTSGADAGASAAAPADFRLHRALFGFVTKFLSPYEFNPADINPLRARLRELVDFERLQRDPPIDLYLCATDVANGERRTFSGLEVTADAVLASACLPHLHHAIKVGDRHYWDGGYTANPHLLPLIWESDADDTLIVQLLSRIDGELPTHMPEIVERVNRIVFSASLQHELELIRACSELAQEGIGFGRPKSARLKRHRFHLIDATEALAPQEHGSWLRLDWNFLTSLHDAGRRSASDWLATRAVPTTRRAAPPAMPSRLASSPGFSR
jgi:NTE family protein